MTKIIGKVNAIYCRSVIKADYWTEVARQSGRIEDVDKALEETKYLSNINVIEDEYGLISIDHFSSSSFFPQFLRLCPRSDSDINFAIHPDSMLTVSKEDIFLILDSLK
jgi:hypothetical protein